MKHDLPCMQPELLTPAEIIDPGAGDPRLLTRSPVRSIASAADLAPPPPRRGSETAIHLPSRHGDTLRYRDGHVTDLQGNLIHKGARS